MWWRNQNKILWNKFRWTEGRPIMHISLWQTLINLLNRYEGKEVCRQEILEELRGMNFASSRNINTIDTYRNYLCKAGFLSTNGRGRYTITEVIPVDLSIEDCREIAYSTPAIMTWANITRDNKKKNEFFSEKEFKI